MLSVLQYSPPLIITKKSEALKKHKAWRSAVLERDKCCQVYGKEENMNDIIFQKLEEEGFIIPSSSPFPVDKKEKEKQIKKETLFAINKAKYDKIKSEAKQK